MLQKGTERFPEVSISLGCHSYLLNWRVFMSIDSQPLRSHPYCRITLNRKKIRPPHSSTAVPQASITRNTSGRWSFLMEYLPECHSPVVKVRLSVAIPPVVGLYDFRVL